MTDEAAFMTVLSNSALHMSSMQKGGGRTAEETAVAVKYQTAAVAIVSQRLKTSSSPGSAHIWDAMIGAVSGLVCNAVRTRRVLTNADAHILMLANSVSEAPGQNGIHTSEE